MSVMAKVSGISPGLVATPSRALTQPSFVPCKYLDGPTKNLL